MSRRKREVSKKGQDFDASEELDEYLLPTSLELKDYKEVDPTIVEF